MQFWLCTNERITVFNESKVMPAAMCLALMLILTTGVCLAGEELITTAQYKNGKVIPYILNYQDLSPQYAIILFPGGNGYVNPHMEGDKLVYNLEKNFLLRSRKFIVDDEFVTVTTDSSDSPDRIQAIIDDLKRRFSGVQIYLMGTSNGTISTIALGEYLSDKIAGEIHTSSRASIASFDAKKYMNRHLVVHHQFDSCSVTPLYAAKKSHQKYGTDLLIMTGGKDEGNPCQALSHHGYNGIERETIDAIKKWIKQSRNY